MPYIICEDLESLIKKIDGYAKNPEKELKLHQDETACYICGKIFPKKFGTDKNY